MTRMTGGSASVERKIGRAISCPNGDNERPYGKCYGQVCGVSYPCTQQEYIDPKKAALEERKAANKAASKAAYQKAKRVAHNAKKVRCVETGEVFSSMREAAASIGISDYAFRKYFGSIADGEVLGRHYEEVR